MLPSHRARRRLRFRAAGRADRAGGRSARNVAPAGPAPATGEDRARTHRRPRRFLRRGDLLVVNDTRVFAARLLGRRVPSGGAVECLLLSLPLPPADDGVVEWEALMHPGPEAEARRRVRFEDAAGALHGEVLERQFFGRRHDAARRPRRSHGGVDDADRCDRARAAAALHQAAPTSRRIASATRRSIARARGSVAAPTAGLHFTPGCSRRSPRAASSAPRSRCTSATARSSRCASSASRTRRSIPSRTRSARPRPRAINRALARRPPGRRRRHHHDARARGCARPRRRPGRGRARRDATMFIYPGLRVPGRRRAAHELPPAAVVAADAGVRRSPAANASWRRIARPSHARYRFYSYGDAMLIL